MAHLLRPDDVVPLLAAFLQFSCASELILLVPPLDLFQRRALRKLIPELVQQLWEKLDRLDALVGASFQRPRAREHVRTVGRIDFVEVVQIQVEIVRTQTVTQGLRKEFRVPFVCRCNHSVTSARKKSPGILTWMHVAAITAIRSLV
uniref:Uncharacterized protein n=1 Tax=Ixodes ricinus TaxID=34613 RepID=A0A6B0UUT7_IXORI